jgi:hypothetical protein
MTDRITHAAHLLTEPRSVRQINDLAALHLTDDEYGRAADLAFDMLSRTRTVDVRLRVTPAEKARIHEAADAEGVTVSDYIRSRIGL